QVGQDKSFVYVAKADGTVEMRTVKTGATVGSMTMIDDGLKPGEQVVTDGQLRLVPGAKWQVRTPGQGGAVREIKVVDNSRIRVGKDKAAADAEDKFSRCQYRER